MFSNLFETLGSTAATDGSTLRTSPAEQGGSAESESGGSGVDSITGILVPFFATFQLHVK